MATLAPVLGGNAASFERPVESGSTGIQGLASVLGTLGNAYFGALDAQPTPRQPTQDEMFGEAWRNFQESQGVALDPSNPNFTANLRRATPAFLQAHPEFASQVGSLLGQYGVENTLTPTQRVDLQREDLLVEYLGTAEGVIVESQARAAATTPDGVFDEVAYDNFIMESFGQRVTTDAELANLAREAEATGNVEAISDRMWRAYTPSAETMVDAALTDVFSLVEQMRLNPGGRIDLTQEYSADQLMAMGIPTGTVTAENLPLVLTTMRNSLRQAIRSGLEQNTNVDASRLIPPSEDWYNQVLAPFDAIVNAAGDFEAIGNVRGLIQNAGITEAMRRMQREDPELYAKINTLSVIPPEALMTIDLALLGISEDVRDYFLLSNAADIPVGDRETRADRMSVDQAQDMVDMNVALLSGAPLENTNLRNAITDVFAGLARVAPDAYLGQETWNQSIAINAIQLAQAAQEDPEFATYLGNQLAGDLSRTLTQVQNEISGTVLRPTLNADGTLSLTIDEGLIEQQLNEMNIINPSQRFQEAENLRLLAEANANTNALNLYNSKVAAIGQMNQVGSQVLDAIVLQNQNLLPVEGGAGNAEPAGGPEGDTLSSGSSPSLVTLPEGVNSDQAFIDEVFRVSDRLGMNPNDLLGIISFETGGTFDPAIRNAAGSGATGLIQFMPSTAEGLGISTEALASMTRAEQMQWVERYFEPYAGRINNFGDAYMAVLYPAAIGKPDDYVLFDGGIAYEQNAGLDLDGDGKVTRGEAVAQAAQRAGVTNYQAGYGPVGTRGTFVSGPAPAPYSPVQSDTSGGVVRPMARPLGGTSEAPMRPMARPTSNSQTESRRTSASQQATRASREKAIATLLRNGFSRSELNAMGIT